MRYKRIKRVCLRMMEDLADNRSDKEVMEDAEIHLEDTQEAVLTLEIVCVDKRKGIIWVMDAA